MKDITHNIQDLLSPEKSESLSYIGESPTPVAERIAFRFKRRHGITMEWRTVHKILKREGLVRTKRRLKKNMKPIP